MSKWINYRNKVAKPDKKEEAKKDDVSRKHNKEIAEESEHMARVYVDAANAAARKAAVDGQKRDIAEAVGEARAKGVSTVGKVMGNDLSADSATGCMVNDIGVELMIEADENDPNRKEHDFYDDNNDGDDDKDDNKASDIERKEPDVGYELGM